jgi:hypothetical protein
MFRKSLVNAIALAGLAVPCVAQVSEPLYHVTVPEEELRTSSPQCSSGIVYDDGGFNDFYSIGSGNPGDSTMVMKFDLPPGTTKIDQVCACFARLSSGSPSSMSFEAVVYNDNGPGGQPGTFLGSASATASAIPIVGSSQFYSVDLSGSGIVLPDTSVYVGVRWPGGSIFLCGDRSSTTTQRTSYGSGNSGGSWSSLSSTFPTAPPRAMGIRLDPSTVAATCTPSATALCLNNGRFRVEATFDTGNGQSGQAQVVKLTDETGYLWFFSSTNVEVVIKALNACTLNQRFWVYSAGVTDVHVVLTVTDTKAGVVKTYTNPQGRAFLPILDSSAFATCP